MNSKRDISGVRTAQDLERKLGLADIRKATEQARIGVTKTNQTLNDFINTSLEEFMKLQDKIDDKAEIWFGSGMPSLANYPASEWNPEDYQSHVGDLYYDRDTGYSYGFSEDNGYYGWVKIQDQDLSVALAIAEAAQDTADDKRRVFISKPNPPYDEGDLWFDENSEIYICQNPKTETEQYEDGDFVIATSYTEKINTVDGKVVVLQGDVANITGRLTAAEADIEKIETKELMAIEADIGELQAENVSVKERLTAAEADIGIVSADVADISTLMFGSATGSVLQTEFADAVIALISDATIDSAKIVSLVADKITSGQLNTNKVTVCSESGRLNITGDTILIKDADRTRVQIGKDANDDYNIYILDADGKIMFDATGIHKDAIKSPIIVDDMVAGNANISAGKLDIDSLFSEINESTNVIKATQISIDDEGQRLSVAFNTITTEISELEESISSQGTQIGVIQGEIESKIWQQDIEEATEGLATTTEMSTKYSQLEQTIDSFKTEVSSTYSQKTETIANIKFMYAKTESPEEAPTEGWSESYPAWEDGKYIWQKAISTSGSGTETVMAVTCLTGAKGETGLGIKEKEIQYYLSSSDTELLDGSWATDMPSWESGLFLWTREVITWSDDSMTETPAILASAINSANKVADEAQKNIEQTQKEMASSLEQTEEYILSTVTEGYFSKEQAEDLIEQMSTQIEQNAGAIEIRFEQLQQQITETGETIVEQNQFIRLENGEIIIGKSDSPIVSVYTNNALEFRYNGVTVARFTNEVLEVRNIAVENQLKLHENCAGRKGEKYGNGYNLNLVYLG